MYQFPHHLEQTQQRVNQYLNHQFEQLQAYSSPLIDAMKYAVLLGGKRIRPFLVYATGEMLGAPLSQLDNAAGAIECIHAYSLVHDDLPAMDNDALRRGKPTCHIAFDQATAILAGDALQTFAFELLTKVEQNSPLLSSQQQIQLVKVLAQAAGAQGMCLGQSLDLQAEQKQISLDQLELIHRNKTGALLSASVRMGFLCSKHYQQVELEQKLVRYADAIGLAFQVQDDILDIIGSSEQLGKTAGADLIADKSTYPKLLGLEGAKQKAQQLYLSAIAELNEIPFDTTPLRELAHFIIQRNY